MPHATGELGVAQTLRGGERPVTDKTEPTPRVRFRPGTTPRTRPKAERTDRPETMGQKRQQ